MKNSAPMMTMELVWRVAGATVVAVDSTAAMVGTGPAEALCPGRTLVVATGNNVVTHFSMRAYANVNVLEND